MSKNVAVFVDVANIFYAAKAAGVDIDYVTLLKASSAGRDLVRAYAYTGLDPDNENQRNFHEFLRRHGYKVVSKDIRKYGDGKVKANLDIELVVDMMKTARNLDIAIVISGDGDFAPAIRAVQEMGVRVEVVSFRGNTSSDLIDVADQFTDITQIAKVEKGSSRSGRRVADDDEDLSMTEVPDKLFEGTGEPRRRGGRGRTSRTTTETATTPPVRTRRTPATPRVAAVAASAGDVPLVVLPGEKLSRVAAAPVVRDTDDETEDLIAAEIGDVDADETGAEGGPAFESAEDGARRRRRRRGGRGRGRGRREDGLPEGGADEAPAVAAAADDDDFEAPIAAPRRPAASTFGSVWDSQIGVPGTPAAATGGRQARVEEDEDLDEPPIPEYLIAERRQRDAARPGRGGGGVRGGRGGAYAAAMDRERFGGGRGSTMSRFDQGAPRRDAPLRRDGGPNRIDRPDRPAFRPESRPAPRPVNSDEPWSEVPPELEAMLRAQLASGGGRGRPTGGAVPERRPAPVQAEPAVTEAAAAPAASRPARRSSRTAAPAATPVSDAPTGEAADTVAPKRRATRAAKPAGEASSDAAPKKAPTRSTAKATTTRSRAKAAPAAESGAASDDAAPAPKRRTRKTPDASA